MDIHAIINHPWFSNPFMGSIAVIGLTFIVMAIILSALAEYNLGRKY